MRPLAPVLAALIAACGGATSTTSTSEAVTTSPIPVTTTTSLVGSEIESVLAPGAMVGVIGADLDGTHRLMSTPGGSGEVAAELEPTTIGIEALGVARQIDDVIWEEVRYRGNAGFFPRSMLAFIGTAEDVTDQFAGVEAESIQRLAFEVAAEIEATRVVTIAEPGPLEVVSDVIGLGDDSIAGYRVRLAAVEEDGVFRPAVVERTPLCRRGVGGDGSCI